VLLTASIRADVSPLQTDNDEDSVDSHVFYQLQPQQLIDDQQPLPSYTDVKRAMSMLRMGRRDEQTAKKAMGMLRMGKSAPAVTDDKRAMGMLRMGRAMGMLRMGRPADGQTDKRGMPMLRMG